MEEKEFSVIEYRSFFAVRHNPIRQETPMGDGVDTLFDEEGNSLSPGSPDFISQWEEALNDRFNETWEAYFAERN